MLVKSIKFTDCMGNEREEDFHFNLNKAEIMEMQLGVKGGYTEMINRIVKAKDAPAIVKTIKDLILKSYGVPSEDGRSFRKSEELSKDFMETEAYSILFMELTTDENAASAFVQGIVPPDAAKAVAEAQSNGNILNMPTA